MESNKEKDFDDVSMFHEDIKNFDEGSDVTPEVDEDFKDFDEEPDVAPEIDEDLAREELEEAQEEIQEEVEQELAQEQIKSETREDFSHWEELDENNSVVKKYIFQVSKDFVSYIDNLTTDERNAFINDAIQKKFDMEDEQRQKELKNKVAIHFVIMILTICLSAPFILLMVHKAIMATFDNYKYSQENFEKLYKSRFEKDRAYMRSIQYNEEQKMKKKKQ